MGTSLIIPQKEVCLILCGQYLDDRYVTYMQTGLKVIRHVPMVQNHNVFLELHSQRYEN